MVISLPIEPRDDNYEDLVVACFMGLGFFVEANLTLRSGKTEMLQLDLAATAVEAPLDNNVLLEAKSGATGFGDIFKVFGWKTYLNAPRACLIRTTPPKPPEEAALNTLSKETGVDVVTIDPKSFDVAKCDLTLFKTESVAIPDDVRRPLITSAWYGRIGKRLCLSAFQNFARSAQLAAANAAKQYRWAIEKSFFERRPIRKARAVYDAYQTWPGITGMVIAELFGNDADKVNAEWEKVRDTHERAHLQFILMMEQTARLRIIRNGLLHLIQEEKGKQFKHQIHFLGEQIAVGEWMPDAFRNALDILNEQKHRNRIPLLLQLFIEVFGGFYALHDKRDLNALSACTGIPVDDIPACLELYNRFFPTSHGWFFTTKNELRVMKMVPATYHGTGAFLRQNLFNETNYDKLYPQMGWLISKWHNALYKILEPELQVKE